MKVSLQLFKIKLSNFARELDSQALLFSKQKCQNEIFKTITDKADSIESIKIIYFLLKMQ